MRDLFDNKIRITQLWTSSEQWVRHDYEQIIIKIEKNNEIVLNEMFEILWTSSEQYE